MFEAVGVAEDAAEFETGLAVMGIAIEGRTEIDLGPLGLIHAERRLAAQIEGVRRGVGAVVQERQHIRVAAQPVPAAGQPEHGILSRGIDPKGGLVRFRGLGEPELLQKDAAEIEPDGGVCRGEGGRAAKQRRGRIRVHDPIGPGIVPFDRGVVYVARGVSRPHLTLSGDRQGL